MKYSIKRLAVLAFAALATACHSQQPSENAAISALVVSEPNSADIELCEQITQLIYKTAEADADMMNVVRLSTEKFGKLLKAGITIPDSGDMSYINYNIIYHGQDAAPTILQCGPGRVAGKHVEIPLLLHHQSYVNKPAPFSKTWVFSRENGKWRVSDIVTTGAEFANGSLAAELDAHF